MGKKRRLNRFITRWIKSDLPEDRSTVLLLGVTRIPTSPVPARRPCSLPLNTPLSHSQSPLQARRTSFSARRSVVRRNSSLRRRPQEKSLGEFPSSSCVSSSEVQSCSDSTPCGSVTPSNNNPHEITPGTVMDRSVDSIGTCSLDVEASVDLSDWSEISSGGTLRSASILTPIPEPHLPSYLSLACTVNGYSTTTNYDPIRLARSRDASPHRPDNDNLVTKTNLSYSIHNNLLSPPNLVPLPLKVKSKSPIMTDTTSNSQHHHQQYFSSTKTIKSYISGESQFTSNYFTKDTVDACFENGLTNKCITFESKTLHATNGDKLFSYESSAHEPTNGAETKSFIQQRIERLYGPGALAQGFFVSKRQKTRLSECELKPNNVSDKHSKSMSDKLLDDGADIPSMKQSSSSPALPVMRHLRPEFRAQLPIVSPRRTNENYMQKSNTVPTLKDEVKENGHSEEKEKVVPLTDNTVYIKVIPANEEFEEKDGHYFMKVLEDEAVRLLQLADGVENELNTSTDLSEDVIGILRAASGKARLLVSQKMQQFKGLCTNNLTQVEGQAFPTTNEDLQGFWDMVMLQVDQVDALFREIGKLKSNNWKESEPEIKKPACNGGRVKKVVPRSKVNTATEEARKQREAERRKLIEEKRKAMKVQNKKQDIEIFVPESS